MSSRNVLAPRDARGLAIDAPVSRRKFLAGLLAGAGSLTLAACGGGGGGGSTTTATTSNTSGPNTTTNAGTTATSATTATASTSTASNNVATKLAESTSGTTLPPATQLIDASGMNWTISNGRVICGHTNTLCPITPNMLLYWNHTVYARNVAGVWYKNLNGVWSIASDPRSAPIFYGLNGHPLQTTGAYATQTPAQQIAMLADLGATVYRLDCYGATSDAQTLARYAQAAAGTSVTILPCLAFHQAMFTTTEQDNYDWAFQCGVNTATALQAYCSIYEIGNEIDDYCCIGVGETPSSFDNTRFQLVRGLLRGAADGIKSVQPGAKIIRGGGVTTLIGFNNMLWNGTQPDGTSGHPRLTWDYTGWHWYETSGNIITAYDGTATPLNILQNLQQYGVPVWITEVGFNTGDTDQGAAYITQVFNQYFTDRSAYNIAGICFYELFDVAAEGTFGLVNADGVTKKQGYAAYKNFASAHPV
ncbi:hypothetical protein PXJ20_21795 [Paraburkholderia sp. A1RI_3L]|uniref:hypothetical protein n=1 Tax=Paraburkholderia TaxID=1822464 RepID=UPI003B7EDF9C